MKPQHLLPLALVGLWTATSVIAQEATCNSPAACAQSSGLLLEGGGLSTAEQPAEGFYYYTIPGSALLEGLNEVEVTVSDGNDLFLSEQFSFAAPQGTSETLVFELLAHDPEARRAVLRLTEAAGDSASVTIDLNGTLLTRASLPEFVGASEETKTLSTLPTVISNSTVTHYDEDAMRSFELGDSFPFDQFFVCGDGTCSGGTGPFAENCETCPTDCGGPCSICGNRICGPAENCSNCAADCGACPVCPSSLGFEERTQLVSTTFITHSCGGDFFDWQSTSLYEQNRLRYRRSQVERIRFCTGIVGEVEVPGSVSYFDVVCARYLGFFCGGFAPRPSCVYF